MTYQLVYLFAYFRLFPRRNDLVASLFAVCRHLKNRSRIELLVVGISPKVKSNIVVLVLYVLHRVSSWDKLSVLHRVIGERWDHKPSILVEKVVTCLIQSPVFHISEVFEQISCNFILKFFITAKILLWQNLIERFIDS